MRTALSLLVTPVLLMACSVDPPPKLAAPRAPEAIPSLASPGSSPSGCSGGAVVITQQCEATDAEAPRILGGDLRPHVCEPAHSPFEAGLVQMEATIDSAGRVTRAQVIHSYPPCDSACVASLPAHTFAPAVKDGSTVGGRALLLCRPK